MDRQKLLNEALTLPVEERMELAQELWDSVDDAELTLTDELKRELDRRLEQLDKNPQNAIPWQEAKAEILRELRSK